MKKFLALAAAIGALAVAAPASAQSGWQPIDQRQAQLDQRIDVGIRNGSLTRNEAIRLRSEFRDIARLEARYRVDGLSYGERADLDRRFDMLSQRIRYERRDDDDRFDRNDRGDRGWMPINARQRELDRRIDAGLRDRSLSRIEAERLRREFFYIANLEQSYRRNGLSIGERRDLDRRFDRLSYRIEAERRDNDNRYG